MADDVAIRDANGNVRQVAALETSTGKVVQRQLVQHRVAGAPTDVSNADPLPVAGPLTNDQMRSAPVAIAGDPSGEPVAVTGGVSVSWSPSVAPLTNNQLRAAAVPVDTELPPAAVPTDADINAAVPAVVARGQVWAPDVGGSGFWRRSLATRGDGAGIAPQSTPAVSAHVRGADGLLRQASAASAATDSESGITMPIAAQALYNGATYERARAASREWVTLLASAPRTASAQTPLLALPGGVRGVAVMLEVQAQPATAGSAVTMSVYTSTPNFVWVATLPPTADAPDTGRRVTVPAATDPQGVHHLLLVIHPDARPIRPVSSFLSSQALQMLVPPLLAFDVGHSAGGASWTYSLHYKFLT